MENENETCGVCFMRYDSEDHTPRVLINCGHTLCSSCLTRIISSPALRKCPFDNEVFRRYQKGIDQFPKNFALLAMLEGKNPNLCQIHSKKLTIFCLQDKVKICSDCQISGAHKDHVTKKIEELKAKGIKIKKELEERLAKFEKSSQDAETSKKNCLSQMDEKFGQINKMLKAKKQGWRKQAHSLFGFGNRSLLRAQTSKAIEAIDQACEKEENLTQLDGDFSSLMLKLQPQVRKEEEAAKASEQVSKMMSYLDTFLKNQTDSIGNFELLNFEKEKSKPLPAAEEKSQQNLPSKVVKIKPKSIIKLAKTMFSVEKSENSLSIGIKDPNRKHQGINTADSNRVERIKVTLDQYGSLFQDQVDLDFLDFILQNFGHYTSLLVVFTPLNLNTQRSITLFNLLFCRIQHLTELEICLEDSKIAIDEPMKIFCENILPKATSLKYLTLKISGTLLSDGGLFALAKSLASLGKNLKSFTLRAESTKITDCGIEKIVHSVEGIKALRLYLKETEITDRSLKVLWPKMKNLETFSLDASKTKITIEGVKTIFAGVSKDIKRLSLSFEGVQLPDEVLTLFKERVCPKLEMVDDVHLRLEGKYLKAKAAEVLEKVRKDAVDRRKKV